MQDVLNYRPNLDGIGDYLTSRSKGDRFLMPQFSIDQLGNRVVHSLGATEAILGGDVRSTLVLTEEGVRLVKTETKILSRIQKGDIGGHKIGGGREGDVYLVNLADGSKDPSRIVVKYTYFAKLNNATCIFTPGVDQMRMLQYLRQNNPEPGLSIIEPMLASINMMISRYIRNSVSFEFMNDLQSLVMSEEVILNKYNITADETDGVAKVVHDIKNSEDVRRIISAICTMCSKILIELEVKVAELMQKLPFDLISKNYSVADISEPSNTIFSLDSLIKVIDKYKGISIDFYAPEFRYDCASIMNIAEVGLGYKKPDKV